MNYNKEVLSQCISQYGETAQLTMAMEECAELIQSISKCLRNGKDDIMSRDNLIEEIADVSIMIEQIKIIFGIDDADIQKEIGYKMNRQADRMGMEVK